MQVPQEPLLLTRLSAQLSFHHLHVAANALAAESSGAYVFRGRISPC